MPFRRQQPDYQQRWRWSRKLREIREQMGELRDSVLGRLRGLVAQAEKLASRASCGVQTGVLAGPLLERALTAVRSAVTAIEQLATSAAELKALGL